MKKIFLILAAAMAVTACSDNQTEIEVPFNIENTFWYNSTNTDYMGTGLGFYEDGEAMLMWIISPSRYLVGIYDYIYNSVEKEFFLYGKNGYLYIDGYTEDIADRGYSLNNAGGTVDDSETKLSLYMKYGEPDENFFGVFDYTEDDMSTDLPKSGNIPVCSGADIYSGFLNIVSHD